jgi:hypothetical protein
VNEDRAELARRKARELGDTLHAKQLAYGDSGAIALGLWQARLAQYRHKGEDFPGTPMQTDLDPSRDYYLIPAELIAHLPRITRLDDRINRIVSNPAGDRLGESPWMDAAGDCIIGEIAPRVQPLAPLVVRGYNSCEEPECELAAGHDHEHAKVDAAGRHTWTTPLDRWFEPARFGVAFGDDLPGLK